MAFVQRTTRDQAKIGEYKSATNDSVGPGSYAYQMSITRAKPSYAPFGSTNSRGDYSQTVQIVTPGPGSYVKPDEQRRMPASNSYKSATVRMQAPKKLMTPGPGAYAHVQFIAEGAQKKQNARDRVAHSAGGDPASSVKWVRVPTAPSIPAVAQSFGYEEGPHGELIMQRPIHVGHTGRSGDTVGPGDYNPARTQQESVRSGDFSKSRVPRTDPAKSAGFTNPGPGEYNAKNPSSSALVNKKPSSVFESGTQRSGAPMKSLKKTKVDGPGPGSYAHKSNFGEARKEEHLQFFGSTCRRFEQGPRAEQRATGGPGPGAYSNPESAFKVTTQATLPSPTSTSIGFTSTSTRFHASGKAAAQAALTGPGSYEQDGLAESLDKRLVGRTGVFGTTTKRFHALEADAVPGPGTYKGAAAVVESGAKAVRRKPLSSFASGTRRSGETRIQDVPPPGTYEMPAKWSTGSGQGLLSSGGARFVTTKSAIQNPGPGRYDAKSSLKPPNPNRKNVMCSVTTRFEHKDLSLKFPGPGSYDAEFLYGNLNKPTFNMSIADDSS